MLHFLRECSYLFSHIPPIFSVLLTYSLEINSLLFDPPCSSLVVGYKGSSTETRISSACEVSRRREEPRCDVTSPALRRFDWLPVTRAADSRRARVAQRLARSRPAPRALCWRRRRRYGKCVSLDAARRGAEGRTEVGTLLCNTALSRRAPAIDIDSAPLRQVTPARPALVSARNWNVFAAFPETLPTRVSTAACSNNAAAVTRCFCIVTRIRPLPSSLCGVVLGFRSGRVSSAIR